MTTQPIQRGEPASAATATSARRSAWPHLAALLLLPVLLLLVGENWIYPPALIDPWVYHGFFRYAPRFLSEFFPNTYYGSRLSWILPGFAAYQTLPPIVANFTLHLACFYTAVFSFYWLLSMFCERRAALLAAILFGAHGFILSEIGSDYVFGAAAAYYLLTLALSARTAASPRPWLWATLVGAAYAALFYCNLFAVVLSLSFPAAFLYAEWRARRSIRWQRVLAALGGALLGFALLSALLGAVNVALGGNFWFYAPSIHFAQAYANVANPWRTTGTRWVLEKPWLVMPGLLTLAAVLRAVRIAARRVTTDAAGLFFSLNLLYAAGVLVYWQVRGGAVLQWDYYVSLLLGPAFLAGGATLLRETIRIPGPVFACLVATTALMLALPLGGWPQSDLLDPGRFSAVARTLTYAAIALLGAVAVGLRLRWPQRTATLALLLSAIGLVNAVNIPSWQVRPRILFTTVDDCLRAIEQEIRYRPRFWYDQNSPFHDFYLSTTAAYLWRYSLIGLEFPKLDQTALQTAPLTPGTPLILLSEREDAFPLAQSALRSLDLRASLRTTHAVQTPTGSFNLLFLDLWPDWGRPVTVRSDAPDAPAEIITDDAALAAPIPLDRWHAVGPPGAAQVDMQPDGLHIATPPQRWAYAAMYAPITASQAGRYSFVLRYQSVSGNFAFGALRGDQSAWRAKAAEPFREGERWIKYFQIDLASGETIVPIITNDHPTGDQPSSCVLNEMMIYRKE